MLLQPKDLISEGNALMNLGFAAASVFGAALAGGLIALWGVSVALLVDAASFAVIAIVLAVAKDLPQPEHEDRTPWHERYVDGLEFARDNRLVRTLLVGQSLALICFTIVVPIEVIYAKESLKTTERRLRAAAVLVGRRDRDRQPAVPVAQEPRRAVDDPDLQRRGRASPTWACRRRRRWRSPASPRSSAAPATASSGWP